MNLKIFSSPAAVVEALANELLALSTGGGQRHISLSGGSTPKLWFELLARPPYAGGICWKNLHFWWCDERCVPPDAADSNFGVADKLLFSHINIPRKNLHRIRGEEPPEREVSRYSDEIDQYLPKNKAGYPVFDWIHLGVGGDGHTASLFPGQTDYTDKNWITIARHPETGQRRISQTASLLAAGTRLTYLLLGNGKSAILAQMQKRIEDKAQLSDPLPWPAARIRSIDGITEWYLDQAAASFVDADQT
ncbi:MAG: 6-phosphogluconolactonase [Deltaproteobacteria bacterium]|nr:MAG: 6-phosphogluconolactonase [Deltaproteobacteria bacterium]PIE72908.1 MAG: 6-phosphogluconolactonase [Deltaproteobacteria bacterium]